MRAAPLRFVLLAVLSAACSVPAQEGAPRWAPAGAEPYAAELQKRLTEALQARGPAYVPRTRHLRDDQSPRYTNRLIFESSPYLLQHAHNPVDWYPWGDEAFAAARRLGRPVLLSIGYSTCHWCHVMEEESFEDEEIAAYLNANYVAIKVDREERPDIDAIYMSAVQMMVGRGGWPMTTWLTPDRKPFFGGTYFPARDGDRGTRRGFLTLLRELRATYDEQPDTVAQRAAEIASRIVASLTPTAAGDLPGQEQVDLAVQRYRSLFDARWGGLNRAPKFPSSLPIRLLLRYHRRTGDDAVLQMAELTLTRMAQGGMYDQLGGGFHRYSVDGEWLVPHFEKMLYDNALLAVAYLEGYQATGDEESARIAREILDYVAREMTSPRGAFYSATDADSPNPDGEREEGWFFTWTPAEIDRVLGGEEAQAVKAYYGVTARGNFEGRSILHVRRSHDEVAAELGIDAAALRIRLAAAREKLYRERSRRPPPLRDDKILTSWNGLMISAFATGGFVLDDEEFLARAGAAADFVLAHLREDERLLRSFKDGRARHNAYLDDYAFLIQGLLDLYEAGAGIERLEQALELQAVLDAHYREADAGGYFMTSDDHEQLLAREKPAYDGAEPSGNSIALLNLLRLHELTGEERYRVSAEALLAAFSSVLQRSPTALSEMLLGLDYRFGEPLEIVIVSGRSPSGAAPFLDVLRRSFVPNKVVVHARQGAELGRQAELIPWVKGKIARKGKATAYVCQQGVCQLPAGDAAVFAEQLARQAAPGVQPAIDSSAESR